MFVQPMAELRDELGIVERDERVRQDLTIRVTEVPMGEGVADSVSMYQMDILTKMRRSGWLKYEVVNARTGDTWLYRVTLLAKPEELDNLPEPEASAVPNKLIPIGTIELEKAFKRLIGASIEHRGERFVGNPEALLDQHFGANYDAMNTINLLIDAGLAEWRNGAGSGTTTERLFLHPPKKVEEAPPPIEAKPDPLDALRAKRAGFAEIQRVKAEAEQGVRAEADGVRARLQALNEQADRLAEERVAAARKVEEIDMAIRELEEINRLEQELATRRARALETLKG